ncbi:MAG: hypothetical protein NTW49_01295 [Bacteroidia bacterium]|nr:hypothetical protein [Bacteroidia bacterium]
MNPYLLIPVGAIIGSLYFYTWFAALTGMTRKAFHRKLWNYILLITFLVTAVLGILMAIQIDFKLEIPYIKEILSYHVNFGIAMSLIALFHLCWHIRYYFPSLNFIGNKKEIQASSGIESSGYTPKQVKSLLLILCVSMSMIQVIFLRLFISIFYGNELIIGVFLALWMSLTGLGSWLGKKQDIETCGTNQKIIVLLSYSFFALVIGTLMSQVKAWFVPVGVLINTWQLMLMLVLFLLPVCICSGFVFRILASVQPDKGTDNYISETTGSIIGGIIITFTVVLFLEPGQVLAMVFALNIIASAIFFTRNMILRYAAILLALVIPVLFIVLRIDLLTKAPLFKNQKIIETHDTPYGALTITESAGQLYLFSNMTLQYTGNDIVYNEETAHFPGLQHADPVKVLLVSGGYMGIVPEILKYSSVRQIIYIEPNPWFLKYSKKYFNPAPDPKIKVIRQDPRRFLLTDTAHYDVIIMDVPESSTIQLNRYFSLEFMQLLKTHSTRHTITSYSLSTSGNYMSRENSRLHSILFNTMRDVYSYVIIVPGSRNYFIASDSPVSLDYEKLFLSKNIETQYVNPYYMENQSLMERSEYIQQSLDRNAPVNTDLNPSALWAQTTNFFSLFNVNAVALFIIILALLLVPMFRLNLVSYSVFVTGFTASSLEMLILIVFQVMFGYLYAATGLIFAVFMGGLTLGARQQKKWGDAPLFKIQFLVMMIALLVSGIILLLPKISAGYLLYIIIGLITFIPAYLCGFQFALALRKLPETFENKTGYLYGVDLFGSALGLLVISTVLIPVFGYISSIFVLVVFNLISFLILWYFKK